MDLKNIQELYMICTLLNHMLEIEEILYCEENRSIHMHIFL